MIDEFMGLQPNAISLSTFKGLYVNICIYYWKKSIEIILKIRYIKFHICKNR